MKNGRLIKRSEKPGAGLLFYKRVSAYAGTIFIHKMDHVRTGSKSFNI